MKQPLLTRLELTGLQIAPPQLLGSVRLFPVVCPEPTSDLRFGQRSYDEPLGVVGLNGGGDSGGGDSGGDYKETYTAYIPHGLVVSWTRGDEAATAFGATLDRRQDRKSGNLVRVHHRMARRDARNRLRLLPRHLALEGFLGLHFGGPSIAWSDYSKFAIRHGLGARFESTVPGGLVPGLADALRLFEIHEQQVGMLVFVSDALAGAFVVSHPDDYRLLHQSLIDDFFAELLVHYGTHGFAGNMELTLDDSEVDDLASLERAVLDVHDRWEQQAEVLASGLIDRPVTSERVYRLGAFQLQRFSTELASSAECHIGEAITGDDGRLHYLNTFRLSNNQINKALLLQRLSDHQWNLEAAARAKGDTKDDLIKWMETLGFGYLINPETLASARRSRRRR